MTSKEVIQLHFPGAKYVKHPTFGHVIAYQDTFLPHPNYVPKPPTALTEEHAWNICVKHPVTRERYLAIHMGKLVKFLNDVDHAELTLGAVASGTIYFQPTELSYIEGGLSVGGTFVSLGEPIEEKLNTDEIALVPQSNVVIPDDKEKTNFIDVSSREW